jgi:hypothetical protein
MQVAEMIAAMRHGLGRRPNVFPLPAALLQLLLCAAGREEIYQRLKQPEEIVRRTKKARNKSRAFVISVEGGLNSPCRPCHRQA